MRESVAWIACLVFCIAFSPGTHADASATTLYIVGDSTAASYPPDRSPLAGWGQTLQEFFDGEKLTVENRARSGRSSKSFYDEGAWAPIEAALKPGDYVFIQFGHNDSKDDPKRFTVPDTTYREYLGKYIAATRAKGATPVLLTSINRLRWASDTQLEDTMGGYPEAARQVAKEQGVALIDLHQQSRKLYESLGPDRAKELFLILDKGVSPNYPDGINDTTHLRESGAREICKLVAQSILEQKLPLSAHLLDMSKELPG